MSGWYFPGDAGSTMDSSDTPLSGGSSNVSLCSGCAGSGVANGTVCGDCGGTGLENPQDEASSDWVWSQQSPEGWDYMLGGPVGTTN